MSPRSAEEAAKAYHERLEHYRRTGERDVVTRITDHFRWIEERDMRVGQVWLNPIQAVELHECKDVFDPAASKVVIDARWEATGGVLIGFLFGAEVYTSAKIVKDHVMVFPSGWEIKILDGSGCTPL